MILGYPKKQLTKAFSLTIPEHSWYGIVGENGTGKSTFFKTLPGLQAPLSGHIKMTDTIFHKAYQKISYIPQERAQCLIKHDGERLYSSYLPCFKMGAPYTL